MKVSLLSENILKKLLLVNHAVSNRSQLPVLLNFLIKTKKKTLSISATDLEIGIETNIAANVEEEGETTVPARTFLELMGTVSTGKVFLETERGSLVLSGKGLKTVFQTTKPEEFPKLYEDTGEEVAIINRKEIEKNFSRVVFAASQDQTRPALSGVLIKEKKEEGFFVVATDGYRLSLQKITLEKKGKPEGETQMLIPSRTIRELILLASGDDGVRIYSSCQSNQVVFRQNDTTLVGRLIEAEFPVFEKIIPIDFSTRTEFDKEALQKAVKSCYVFARNAANIVKLSIKKEKIVAYVNAPSVGENTVEVEAQTTGEENEIAFNARYLLDLFSNIEEETMSFEMMGPLNPGVFKVVGDESFLHLIMPIRVQQEP